MISVELNSCQWAIVESEIVAIAPNIETANQLWESLDWSKVQPTCNGLPIAIWCKNRLFAHSKAVRP